MSTSPQIFASDYDPKIARLFRRSMQGKQFAEWYRYKFEGLGPLLWDGYYRTGRHPYKAADFAIAKRSSAVLGELIGSRHVCLNFLGSGGGAGKEFWLSRAFNERVRAINSMDISRDYAERSLETAQSKFGEGIVYSAQQCNDFFQPFERLGTDHCVVSILFGGHFFNIPKQADAGPPHEEAKVRLRNLFHSHAVGDILFLTSNTSQDKDRNVEAYSGSESAVFTTNLANIICDRTPYRVDADTAGYEVRWVPESHLLSQSLVLRDFYFQDRSVDRAEFQTTNVYMIPPEMFKAWCVETGWGPHEAANSVGVQGYILERLDAA